MKTRIEQQGPKMKSVPCTASQMPTHTKSAVAHAPVYGGVLAANADARPLAVIGCESRRPQLPPMGGVAPAVAKKSGPSSPSTTSMGVARSKENKDFAVGVSTSGSENAATQKTTTRFSALTATAPKAKTESAPIKNKFTPGLWTYQNDPDTGDRVVIDENFMVICARPNEANARLIAAAPDLLEAAEIAEKAIAYHGTPTQGLASALGHLRAAIAKAEGR